MDPELLTTPQAAARLGVGLRRIQQFIAEGRLPGAKRIGRDWFIPAPAVENMPPRKSGRPRGKKVG